MDEEKQPEFQVTDRRRVTSEGDLREGVEDAPRPEPTPSLPLSRPAAQPAGPTPSVLAPSAPGLSAPAPSAPAPSVEAEQAARKYAAVGTGIGPSFDKIVVFFTQTAMLQLGLLTTDPSQPLEPDLFGARDTIDMLALLADKTRGNLTPAEQRLLDSSIYELRMAWMELNRKYSKAP